MEEGGPADPAKVELRAEPSQNNLCLSLMQRKVLGSQVSLDKKGKDAVLDPEGTEDPKQGSKENVNMVRDAGRRICFVAQC